MGECTKEGAGAARSYDGRLGEPSTIPLENPEPPRRRKRRGMPDVQCLGCGYALKGSPTPVCPECGEEWRFEAAERDARNQLSGPERAGEAALSLYFLLGAVVVGTVCAQAIRRGIGQMWVLALASGVSAIYLLVLSGDAVRSVVRRRRSSLRETLRLRNYVKDGSD